MMQFLVIIIYISVLCGIGRACEKTNVELGEDQSDPAMKMWHRMYDKPEHRNKTEGHYTSERSQPDKDCKADMSRS